MTPTSARQLLEAAREALRPFAAMGKLLESPFAPALFRDEDPIGMGGAWRENGETRTITYGDLRRTRHLAEQIDQWVAGEGWQDIASAPLDTWVLVYMPTEHEGSGRVHAARNRKIGNGYSWVIGHQFSYDCEPPTLWKPLDPPRG